MLINNKLTLGFFLGLCLIKPGCAMDHNNVTPAFKTGRSVAASSVRSTISRKEANLSKPIEYGKIEELYHPLCKALFRAETVVSDWRLLDSLVQPNEGNLFSPQSTERVRNIVVDIGISVISKSVVQQNSEHVRLSAVNLMIFLLRPGFPSSEFNSWQSSFAKAVGASEALELRSSVQSNPNEFMRGELFESWTKLFVGANGVVQRYHSKRTDEKMRANTFDLFESLFADTVNDLLINRRLEERLQQERAAADLARKESEAKTAAENAARDATLKQLTEQLSRLEKQQQSSDKQQANKKTDGCSVQ